MEHIESFNKNQRIHRGLKLVASILPAIIFILNYTWITSESYIKFAGVLIFILINLSVSQLVDKNHILERIFRLTEIGFFLLPVSAIIITMNVMIATSSAFEMLGSTFGGMVVVFGTLIIGFAGGIIMHIIANKYDKKIEKQDDQSKNILQTHGIIFFLLSFILLSILFGSISITRNTTIEKNDDLQLGELSENIHSNATTDLKKEVTLRVSNKGFIKADYTSGSYEDYISLDLNFKNETDRDIRGVSGTITFYDIFENKIQSIGITYDKGISMGEEKLFKSVVTYNQFIDSDVKLKNTELENLKYEWEIEKVIYNDTNN